MQAIQSMRSGPRQLRVLVALALGACATGSLDADGGPDAELAADVDGAAAETVDASLPSGGRDADSGPSASDAAAAPDAPGPPDAGPAPDAAPCTPTWIPLLVNGGFDSGATGWTISGGTVIYASASMPISAHGGGYAAWLVGYNNANEQAHQTVAVPAGASALRLRGYGCYVTTDTGGPHDFLTIRLRNGGGTPLETLATYSNQDVGAVCDWTAFELAAATPHAGETIQLHVQGTSDGLYVTSYFIDSLQLEAYACP